MDTRQVADTLGIDPKLLRRFIRSPQCSFTACGSGGRYEFTPDDIPRLSEELAGWLATHKERALVKPPVKPKASRRSKPTPEEYDRAVWDEEGEVILPDIRDPRVRAGVRRQQLAQEARLDAQLMAAGLHVAQRPANVR
jgi:hypothetical protein